MKRVIYYDGRSINKNDTRLSRKAITASVLVYTGAGLRKKICTNEIMTVDLVLDENSVRNTFFECAKKRYFNFQLFWKEKIERNEVKVKYEKRNKKLSKRGENCQIHMIVRHLRRKFKFLL